MKNYDGGRQTYMGIISRGVLTSVAACMATTSFAQPAVAEFGLEIDRQPLADALNEFSKQTGVQIAYFSSKSAQSMLAGPIHGRYTVDDAISRLLLPIGLSFERPNERTIAVVQPSKKRTSSRPMLLGATGATPSFLPAAGIHLADSSATEGGQQAGPGGQGAEPKSRPRGIEEEVVVTAQRREERLQDVPIAITVLGGEQLDSSVQGVNEQLNRVPGVATMVAPLGGTLLTVRGVTAANTNFAGSSPIGYYLDSVPFGFVRSAIGPDSNAYDLERVEVLRGPQGTLYGASAQNGVVRVLTRDPDLEKVELKVRTAGSSTEDGGENYRGDVVLNLPIVSGKLAARAVVGYEDWSGWIDQPGRKDANDAEIRNLRLKVRAQPTDKLSVDLSAWSAKTDSDARAIGAENRTNIIPIDEPSSIDYDVYGLEVGYDFSAFTVSSSTSYLDYSNVGLIDFSLGVGALLPLTSNFDSTVFSQEFNLNSLDAGAWKWSIGGIYRDGEDNFQQRLPIFANPSGIKYNDYSESFAVFGQLTRLFLDGQLELTGGLRYFEDEVENRQLSNPSSTTVALIRSDGKFDAVSPRVVMTWHASDDMTVYTSYSEGFRSGFPQSPTVKAAAPGFPPVDSDNLVNYEIGSKGSLWDGRLSFDAAVFYIDWEDIQQSITVDAVSGTGTPLRVAALINGESADGLGAEFGVTTSPIPGLELGINYSWNDLTFSGDIFTLTSAGVPVLLFAEGDRLTNSPEHTAGVSIDYEFSLGGNGYEGLFSGSANYISSRTTRGLIAGVTNVREGDNMLTSRLSFAVSSPAGWSASLFVDNLNDERGTPFVGPNAIPEFNRIRPRTIGLQLEYHL